MKKSIVYIAGPYRSKYGRIGVIINIWKARQLAKKLWAKGIYTITPHLNSALMDRVCDSQIFLDGDIEIMKRCNYVLLLDSWNDSKGTINEIEVALSNGIRVFDTHETNDLIDILRD